MPQDKPRIYYPRIGEDLIDYATEMGADVANFDISQLSSSEITNITLTGICVSGETQFLCFCINSLMVSVFEPLFSQSFSSCQMISAECPTFGTIICTDSYTEANGVPEVLDVTQCYGLCCVTQSHSFSLYVSIFLCSNAFFVLQAVS